MRITSLLAFFIVILGGLDLLSFGLFKVFPSSILLGSGSFLQRLFYCLVGVATIFFILFVNVFKPFKSLSK